MDVGDDLHAAAAGTDDGYAFVVERIAFFVGGRVHEFAFVGVETRDIGPLEVVQDTSCVDEEFGFVFEDAVVG